MTNFYTKVDSPNFSVRLTIENKNGLLFQGTGFRVDYAQRHWLITCRHNLEIEQFKFSGTHDVAKIMPSVAGATSFYLENRAVVNVKINGVIADAVALEIDPENFKDVPVFDGVKPIAFSGDIDLPEKIPLTAGGLSIVIPIHDHYHVQGFPDLTTGKTATTIHTVGSKGFPIIHPWMMAYVPSAAAGFSGGPVVKLEPTSVRLCGIHTHSYKGSIGGNIGGQDFEADLTFGGAVAIEPLLKAIDKASGSFETTCDVVLD
jgi:hypothetical protein